MSTPQGDQPQQEQPTPITTVNVGGYEQPLPAPSSSPPQQQQQPEQIETVTKNDDKKQQHHQPPKRTFDDFFQYDEKTSWLLLKNRPIWLNAILIFVLIIAGFAQGAAYHRIGLTNPQAITEQFTFRVWMVMRFFFSSMGCALFFQAVFEFIMPSLFDMSREVRRTKVGYLRSILGGCVLGIGLALCGDGAAITGAQLGADTGNIGYVIIGLFAGALATSLVSKFLGVPMHEPAEACPLPVSKNNNNNNKSSYEKIELKEGGDQNNNDVSNTANSSEAGKSSITDFATVDDYLNIRYWKLAAPFGLIIFACACILEFAIPGTSKEDDQRDLMFRLHWHTVVGGVFTGLNNVIFPLIMNQNLSGARTYFYPISLLSWGYLAETEFPNTWVHLGQVLMFWLGMPLGALTSLKTAIAADEEKWGNLAVATALNTAPGLGSIWRSIVGGFLTTVAVFIAGDCNCGKSIGISFSFENILMTGCLFGCAIATGWVIYGAEQA